MSGEFWNWVALILAAALLLAAIVLLGWALTRFLYFVLIRLPAKIREPQQSRVVLSLVIALIPMGDVTGYLVTVCRSFVAVLEIILSEISSALSSCEFSCAETVTFAISRISEELVSQARLLVGTFPTLSALFFVILAAATYAVLNSVRVKRADGTTVSGFDAPGVSSLTFIAIVLFSMYLSLVALLAVPLMQREVPPDGYNQTAFEARIGREVPSHQEFLQLFPQLVMRPGTTEPSEEMRAVAARIPLWNANRDLAFQALVARKNIAIETFRSQTALGLGGREVVSHDAALYQWLTDQREYIYQQLGRCLAAGRDALNAASTPTGTAQTPSVFTRTFSRAPGDLSTADSSCDISRFGTSLEAPGRTNRVEGLTSFIRDWTRWLIGPESMPLIIIVGLIGFSFLGASLSRVIRLGVGKQLETLSVSDLLLVILSGASAALLIFLASYGGLVVLGESDSDPSPYVVFALCFVASIFSEDVWAWARTNILGRVGTVKLDNPPAEAPAQPGKRG
jgi:hypothetical protein